MREFSSKIFIDGGDPKETLEAKKLLGFIDGQTTNPTLIAKNPEVQARLDKGEKFSGPEIMDFYKTVIGELDAIVDWSISIEPYVDSQTTVSEILSQAREMHTWSKKAWVKFPTTKAGLEAASLAVKEGIRANMTLVFTQEQAAAVYSATKGSKEIFVSPFVGRLDDRGDDGMSLIQNLLEMFKVSDHHVLTLTASVRSLDHLKYALSLESPIITLPFKVFKEWAAAEFDLPGKEYVYQRGTLKEIPYREINLAQNWREYDLYHPLTDIGVDRFASDWNALVI